jgi:hypothetical protein
LTSSPAELSHEQSEPLAARRRGAPGPRHRRPAAWTDRAWAWTLGPVAGAVLARSASRVDLAAAGAPTAALAVSALYIGAAVIAVTPGVALLSFLLRRGALRPATAFGAMLAGSGGAAMAAFWAWYLSPHLGRDFDVALGAGAVLVIAVFGRRGDLRTAGLSVPMLLGLAIGLAFTGLTFIQGDGIAYHVLDAVGGRYWQTGDNALPLQLAEKVAGHKRLSGPMVDGWLASDRPPLQSGYALAQWPLWSPAGRPAAYQLLSTGLAASWLPGLWVVLRARGVGQWRVLVVVLATTLTGFALVNDLFVWPKFLAGTFALGAIAIVLSRDEADRRMLGWVVAITLATLSMLAHGGTIFALLALIPFALRRQSRVPLRALAVSVIPAAACYVPWTLFQHFVDPPGNRLLKWQVAGVIGIDSRGFLKTLVMQYEALSWHGLLHNKWVNVESLVANPLLWRTMTPEHAWRAGFLGYARLAELNDLLPAAGLLLIGVLALLPRTSRRALAPVAPLAVLCGIAVAAWVVLLWGNGITTINHQGAYAVIVLFIALCALAVTYLPWPAAALLLVGNAAWFAVSWVPGLGFTPAATDETRSMMQFSPAMLLVCLAGLILAAAAIAWLRFASGPGPARPASALLDGPEIPELSLPLPGAAQNSTVVHDAPPLLVSSSLPGIP